MIRADASKIVTEKVEKNTPSAWSSEQETALMLHLCEAQMEAAVRDSDHSVDALVSAFTELVSTSRSVADLARQASQSATVATPVNEELNRRCNAISKQINDAVIAFQFYDKLSQRLGHVRHSMTMLSMFICDRSRTEQRDHWVKLMTALRKLYRTAEERAVFDSVAEGIIADEVRAGAQEPTAEVESHDELF